MTYFENYYSLIRNLNFEKIKKCQENYKSQKLFKIQEITKLENIIFLCLTLKRKMMLRNDFRDRIYFIYS